MNVNVMWNFLKDNKEVLSLSIAIIALLQPWIIGLWKRIFRAPKLEIYPSGTIEIGYSQWGPFLGINGTLRSVRGDVFVKSMRLQTNHLETNEEHNFEWVAFRSAFVAVGQTATQPMELPAGFIVTLAQPHRYNFFFVDSTTQEHIFRLLVSLATRAYLIGQAKFLTLARQAANWGQILGGVMKEYQATPEYSSALDEISRRCYWREGRYALEICVNTNKRDSHFRKNLIFDLPEGQVSLLRQNTQIVADSPLRAAAGEPGPNLYVGYVKFSESSESRHA